MTRLARRRATAVYDGRVPQRRRASLPGRTLTLAILVAALALATGRGTPPAAADDGRAAVALIPFTADKRLALYGKPVAAEVTRALRDAGLDVTLVSDGAPVPSRARLVIDGRLVRRGAGVVIEARVRDPERGVDVARPSGAAASLDDIDRAAAAVSAELVAAIRAGLAAQDAQAARAAAALAPPALAASPVRLDVPAPAADRRPLAVVVVGAPGMEAAPVDVPALLAPAALELGRQLGHRVVVQAAGPDGAAPTALAAVGSERAAPLVIGFELLGFHAGRQGDIPVARARARVTVVAAAGALYRRVVRTDTVVGSRGDRVDTLVRFAAAQVTDVVAPRIRERLRAAGQAPGDPGPR